MELTQLLSKTLMESVHDTFSATMSLTPQILTDSVNDFHEDCIISSIGFTGAIEGSCLYVINDKSACHAVSKMLFTEMPEVTKDVIDGVGEICNMVIGGVKMKIANTPYSYEISIPTTVRGKDMQVLNMSSDVTMINQAYQCDGDIKFKVTILFKRHTSNQDSLAKLRSKVQEAHKATQQVATEVKKTDPFAALNNVSSNQQSK